MGFFGFVARGWGLRGWGLLGVWQWVSGFGLEGDINSFLGWINGSEGDRWAKCMGLDGGRVEGDLRLGEGKGGRGLNSGF